VTTVPSGTLIYVGQLSLLRSIVTTAGPSTTPITFTDRLSAGLTVNSVTAESGSCAVSGQAATGQLVTCTLSGLSPGGQAAVNMIVTAASAGQFTTSVGVSTGSGVPDPNPANDTASATLSAASPVPVPNCTVPSLGRTPLSTARTVLGLLHCKVGKVTHAFSNSIAKGLVIKTTPRAGSYPNATTVSLLVSSGRKPKPHKRHH